MMNINPVELAVANLGSQQAIADVMEVGPMVVSQWKRRGVAAKRAREFSEKTGVPIEKVRPDLFGPDPAKTPHPEQEHAA